MIQRACTFSIALMLAVGLVACGGGGGSGGGQGGSGSAATEGGGSETTSGVRTVTITPVGNQMKYEQTTIKAPAGSELRIVMANTATSPAMHHNVVVLSTTNTAYIDTVGQAALQAKQNDYIPPEQSAWILGNTAMAAPGDTTEVTITVPEEPGDYPYLCTYPGHYQTMQGTLIAQ